MKTYFDKITENPDILSHFLNDLDSSCFVCQLFKDGKGYPNCKHNQCCGGIKDWLLRTLPMNEQFTDEEIEFAKQIKQQGFNYIARDKCGSVWAYEKKPIRIGKEWSDSTQNGLIPDFIDELKFLYIKWEDEPILLDDIINSRNIQKSIDK